MSKFSDDVAALTAAETTYETVLSVIEARIEADQSTIATLQNEINELESENIDTSGLEQILDIVQQDAAALEAAIASAPAPAPAPTSVIEPISTPTVTSSATTEPPQTTPPTPPIESVEVEPTAPVTVSKVDITPNTVLVAEGGTQQFSATVTLSDGTNETNFTPTWTANNGTISSSGLYTAPAGSSDTVTVNVAGVTGIAVVTITQTTTSAA